MATTKKTDPLHGHCLCQAHATAFAPRRTGVKFFFIPPDAVPQEMACGRCAPGTVQHGGLVVSEESLEQGVVTFLKNAAMDLRALKAKAVPLS